MDLNAKCTVMVVDDHASIREVMCRMLTFGGYSVIAEATNGVEAVEKYKEFLPALTIMDVAMPLKDGIEATKEVIACNRDAKVVICTSMEIEAIALVAKDAGACGVITKPFLYAQVHELLDSIVKEPCARQGVTLSPRHSCSPCL